VVEPAGDSARTRARRSRERGRGPGRPRGPRAAAARSTRTQILDGALAAVATHGLAKVTMSDVSACAGVSRGTAYRYFPSLDALLTELGTREAERFEREVWQAMEAASGAEQRLQVALDYAARIAREHPALQRLPQTDPGLVLTALRARFPQIRASIGRLFGPLLADTEPVRSGAVGSEQLVDWMTRLLVSTFLFPDPRLDDTAAGLRAVLRRLAPPPG